MSATTTQMDLEARRQRIQNIVRLLALLTVGFFVAPFIFIAIKGLVGLAIAGTMGIGMYYLSFPISAALANWRLKLIKAEAARNPVETLQNDYQKRQSALNSFKESIRNFTAEVQTFADKLSMFTKQYPAEAPKYRDQLSKMNQLLQLREAKFKQAQKNLADYEMEIQKAGAIWEMGCAAAKMNKAAGMTEDDFFAKIQVETALDSVQKNLNMAFADLEVSLLDEDNSATNGQTSIAAMGQPKQIAGTTVDVDSQVVNAYKSPESVKVSRRF